MPYWNWTANPQIPAVFWDTSSPLYSQFREASPTSVAGPAVSATTINNALAQTNFLMFTGAPAPLNSTAQFGDFAGVIEGTPHNYIHNFVGGRMAQFMSPLDPKFWTHHNRVDQLWVEWNLVRGNPNTNDRRFTDTVFTEFFDRRGLPVSISVLQSQSQREHC